MGRIKKPPKLTLKAAKALAIQEFGTATRLTAHENNNTDYQCYEMMMGKHYVAISNNSYNLYGIVCLRFGNKKTYFDINTLQENVNIAEIERQKERRELIRDMASCSSGYMFEALIDIHGIEECRHMLDKAGKRLNARQ